MNHVVGSLSLIAKESGTMFSFGPQRFGRPPTPPDDSDTISRFCERSCKPVSVTSRGYLQVFVFFFALATIVKPGTRECRPVGRPSAGSSSSVSVSERDGELVNVA